MVIIVRIFFVIAWLLTSCQSLSISSLTQASGICVAPSSLPEENVANIQAAINNGGEVCLEPGEFSLIRAPIGSYNHFAALSTHSGPLVLKGSGPSTILRLIGDQESSTTIVISIDPGSEHILLSSLTIDTTAATNTSEQTHAIGTTGVCSGSTCKPIKDLKIENIRFIHPRNTSSRKGDCIRLLGNAPETELYDVRISGNNFEDCARSAVEIQRGAHQVIIADNTINCESCDQHIDGEASGGGWDFGIIISNNTITSGLNVQGDYAIALTSVDGASVVGNQLDRGIALYRTRNVIVSSNTIRWAATRSEDGGLIRLRNLCTGDVISNNSVQRSGSPGPVISAEFQVNACTEANITGNLLTQNTPRWALYFTSFARGSVANNNIIHTVPAPGYPSVFNRALSGAPITSFLFSTNVITGISSYAVRLSAQPGNIGEGVSLVGNTAVGAPIGLFCEENNFLAPITSSSNAWAPGIFGSAVIQQGN